MKWIVRGSSLEGRIAIPSSKSHTIRALLCAVCTDGVSKIENALCRGDGADAIETARAFGAQVQREGSTLLVSGAAESFDKGVQSIDTGNSGTTMRLFASLASLGSRPRTFTGDASLCSRQMKPLQDALVQLGARISTKDPGRDIPFTVTGPIKPGSVQVDGISSQFVSSLLFSLPLLEEESIVSVYNLHERPYIDITLHWLDFLGIRCEANEQRDHFRIPGNQRYRSFSIRIPGDFSSAAFALVASIITRSPLMLTGLDFKDAQGDKELFDICEQIGIPMEKTEEGIFVNPPAELPSGREIDMNNIPDALPACAVLGCFLPGTTYLVNVAQARYKESDRIAVMASQLRKMGANIHERNDGLEVHCSQLHGAQVSGHSDHRVVMALAVAAMGAQGETVIDTAEAAEVTYAGFARDFAAIGAQITEKEYAS